jgi:uncharacterized HAD superfamily protein
MNGKRLVIDIDGTICEEGPTFSRCLARPIEGAVECINNLHDEGFHITLYTSRSWAEYDMTKAWLDKQGIKYDILLCGKPLYDFWIDDRALPFINWWGVVQCCQK